ncbi:MAG: pirin family protein [Brachymonas sp.]|nr:pirin family protein [Brachymonas sp.]
MKKVLHVYLPPGRHWVGDGFPVHGVFSYERFPENRSPFLLLDYAAPFEFEPNSGYRRGVSAHPHRGFETVTIVYDGEVEHRDSTGAGGVIGPGDVQWMTAGGGILHEEFHSEAYSRSGGLFHMVQLWVNLPAKDKMTAPAYQGIANASIPAVALPDDAGTVRVIAGEYGGQRGPAHTFTPMQVWDVQVKGGKTVSLPQPEGWTTMILAQTGAIHVNGSDAATEARLITLSREGSDVRIEAKDDARLLLLTGEPINEPIFGYGPLVMNNQAEIKQAFDDYAAGKFGQMPSKEEALA